jgi:hypothetical protein
MTSASPLRKAKKMAIGYFAGTDYYRKYNGRTFITNIQWKIK